MASLIGSLCFVMFPNPEHLIIYVDPRKTAILASNGYVDGLLEGPLTLSFKTLHAMVASAYPLQRFHILLHQHISEFSYLKHSKGTTGCLKEKLTSLKAMSRRRNKINHQIIASKKGNTQI